MHLCVQDNDINNEDIYILSNYAVWKGFLISSVLMHRSPLPLTKGLYGSSSAYVPFSTPYIYTYRHLQMSARARQLIQFVTKEGCKQGTKRYFIVQQDNTVVEYLIAVLVPGFYIMDVLFYDNYRFSCLLVWICK